MKRIYTGLAIFGAVMLSLFCFLQHDLRGWTPTDIGDRTSTILPVDPADEKFSVGDCLRGTVKPYQAPKAQEYAGSATMTVISCRSRSSAIEMAVAYLIALFAMFGFMAFSVRSRA